MNHDAEVRALATLKDFWSTQKYPFESWPSWRLRTGSPPEAFVRMSASVANGHFSPI